MVVSGLLHTQLGQGRVKEAAGFFHRAAKRHADMPASPREAIRKYLPGQEILDSLVHTGWVNYVSFSQDNKTLYWSGEAKFNQAPLNPNGTVTPAFSKSQDGPGMALSDSGWQIQDMVFKGGRITSVMVGNNGSRIITGDSTGEVRVWDKGQGKPVMVLKGHSREVSSCVWSTTGKYALSGGKDFSLRLWDTRAGESLKTFSGHSDEVNAVAFRPGGRQVLSASMDKTVRLWDRRSGKCFLTFEGHTTGVNAMDVSRDGQYLITAGADRTVRLWNIEIGRCFHVFEGHTAQVNTVVFHPQGRFAVSGSNDKTLRLWDVRASRFEKMMSFEGRVEKLAVSPDGELLAVVHANVWPPGKQDHLHHKATNP